MGLADIKPDDDILFQYALRPDAVKILYVLTNGS